MWIPLCAAAAVIPAKKFCANCGNEFRPRSTFQTVCKPACLLKKVRQEERQKKERAKLDRALDAQRKRSLETIPELIKKAQHAFNAYIRERDKDQPCICCGRPLGASDVGGSFDCGHYRSTGSASHLRFDERNAHAQRKDCNRWGAGRAVDYRVGLVARIGLEAVESLEADNAPVKWERDTLRQIATIYRGKLRDLKKGLQ
jgi:hypothetical protein